MWRRRRKGQPEFVMNAYLLADGNTFHATSRHGTRKLADWRGRVVSRATAGTIKVAYRVCAYPKRIP